MKHEELLSKEVRDKVTGLQGTCTSFCYYSAATPRICIETVVGGEIKYNWIDTDRVELLADLQAK